MLRVNDSHSQCLGYRVGNGLLSCVLGTVQFLVCIWALTQHAYSMIEHGKILHCDFENGTWTMTAVDAIIFDLGLFKAIWNLNVCIAQQLDGGYGRFMWCISHSLALLFCLPQALRRNTLPPPLLLTPLLVQQSVYCVGLLILSLAALPRVLPIFMGNLLQAPLLPIGFYLIGATLNFFFLNVYWHWYWAVESAFMVKNKQVSHIVSQPSVPIVPHPRRGLNNTGTQTSLEWCSASEQSSFSQQSISTISSLGVVVLMRNPYSPDWSSPATSQTDCSTSIPVHFSGSTE